LITVLVEIIISSFPVFFDTHGSLVNFISYRFSFLLVLLYYLVFDIFNFSFTIAGLQF